ncbi:DoxX family protein [Tersicoccus sp. MR15.9]|uniref:DoxX family protein n=1 Tax=Tersicoccus mangrovi TaxID=3121635 RepID=UPI002FE56220
MTLVRFFARPALAGTFVLSGIDRVRNAATQASSLQPVLGGLRSVAPQVAQYTRDEVTVTRVLGGVQTGAGALLAIGRFSRLASTVLVGTQAVNAWVEFSQAPADTAEQKTARRTQLLKNVGLAGGAALAAVDRNGKPSLAWRAEHAATSAKRSAQRSETRKNIAKTAADAKKNVRSVAADTKKNVQKSTADARTNLQKSTADVRKNVKSTAAKTSKNASRNASKNVSEWQKKAEKQLKAAGIL